MLITVIVYILVVIIQYLAHTSPYFVDDTDKHCILCVLRILLTTLMVIVFEAKARYGHWTSKLAHHGHHIYFVVLTNLWLDG